MTDPADHPYEQIYRTLGELRDVVGEEAETLGLYLRPDMCAGYIPTRWDPLVQSGVTDLGMLLSSDKQEDPDARDPLRLVLAFEIGDVAFSERVQDPAAFEEDKDFRRAVPTKVDMFMSDLQEKAKSGELFSWDETVEEEEE